MSHGGYAATQNYFTTSYAIGSLVAPASDAVGGNGVYRYGSGGVFPTQTYSASNYWVDVVFQPGTGTDTTPPTAPTGLTATAASAAEAKRRREDSD